MSFDVSPAVMAPQKPASRSNGYARTRNACGPSESPGHHGVEEGEGQAGVDWVVVDWVVVDM